MKLPHLKCLVLLIGSNDLCDQARSPEDVAQDIKCLVTYVRAFSQDLYIAVCQIPSRARPPYARYGERVVLANNFLRQRLEPFERVELSQIKGLRNLHQDLFIDDGIHFSLLGNEKLFRVIRGAVQRAFSGIPFFIFLLSLA
jgi:lysophospholipase L1-like esterase